MSLLDELTSLDISSITDARGSLTLTLNSDSVKNLIGNGAIQTAMGSLGGGIGTLQADISNPAQLLEPLVNQLVSFTGGFSSDSLPLADYIRAVGDGAALIVSLLEGLDSDPLKLGRVLGIFSGDAFQRATSLFEGYTSVDLSSLGRFRGMLGAVERGVPSDPSLFAELAMDILVPIPRTSLQSIRLRVDSVLADARNVSFPAGRNAGLLLALNNVAAAANAGDAVRLNAALTALQAARVNTIASVSADLERVAQLIDSLPLDGLVAPLEEAGAALQKAEKGIMEFLKMIGDYLDSARESVEEMDADMIRKMLLWLNSLIEDYLKRYIRDPIEAQIKRAEDWMRGLLNHIPLQSYRAMITDFLLSIAKAINDADLDMPARRVRELLNTIESAIDPTALKNEIESVLGNIEDVYKGVLDTIVDSLETVKSGIDTVAAGAKTVLEKVLEALKSFRRVMDEIQAAVDKLGIEEAADQVIGVLSELRKTAEELLSSLPLPESLRPAIEQLISAIENIDLDEVLSPVKSAAQQFQIPAAVSDTVNQGLARVAELISNLIPDTLIAEIEAEINEFLEQLQKFDPTQFLGELDQYVDEAKSFLSGLDPRPLVEEIRGPFQTALDTIDRFHPARLLEPVAEAYDSLLSGIPLPSPDTALGATHDALNGIGDSIASGIAGTVSQATGVPRAEGSSSGGTTASSSPSATAAASGPPQPEPKFKPGDVLRMLGYLPNRLREALSGLEAGAAGDALEAVDRLCGGLARDLRSVKEAVWEIGERLENETTAFFAPLAKAQFDAQVAISMNFSAGSINVEGSLAIVAQAGPGSLRDALGRGTTAVSENVRMQAATLASSVGIKLEKAAEALERCSLSGLTGSLDDLLAALDVEPIAQKLDDLLAAMLAKAPALLSSLEDELKAFVERLKKNLTMFSPGYLAQKFLGIIDLLLEQLNILDPRRLAAELGEIHKAIRDTIAAYDPAIFAQEIWEILDRLIQGLDALKPSELLAGFSFSDEFINKIKAAMPTEALKDIDRSLDEVGAELAAIDPAGLLEAINNVGPRLLDQFEQALKRVKQEILTLLNAIRFQQTSGSASVSVSGSIG
jgi:hypothetical protein